MKSVMFSKLQYLSIVLILFAIFVAQATIVSAGQLQSRTVQLSSSKPSENTSHRFEFSIPSVSNVGSMEFEYCTNSPFPGDVCTAPAGFSALSAVLGSQNGETGFLIDPATTSNRIVISRLASLTNIGFVSYRFDGLVNPSTINQSVFVRISTFTSSDGTGLRVDEGAVVFRIVDTVTVTAYVPPYLTFCVGVTVVLNCSSTSGTNLNFGELSPTQTKFLTSQFSTATNDVLGYSTTVSGTTMTSGNNIIPALNPPQNSLLGTSQFGMNLRSNIAPAVGADPAGIGTGTAAPQYSTPNTFYFNPGIIASSPNSTEYTLFTVSYIVNVSTTQPAGVYVTTLTYIATASF